MKLLYYDERTPTDYQPEFFRACEEEIPFFQSKPVKVKMGTVSTPYHSLTMKIQTLVDSFDEESQGAQRERVSKMQWSVIEDSGDESTYAYKSDPEKKK